MQSMIKKLLKNATLRIPVLFVCEERTDCRYTRGFFPGIWRVRIIWYMSELSTDKKEASDTVSCVNTPSDRDKVLWQLVCLFSWLFAYLTTHYWFVW